jgi:hypothetical protein
MIEEQAAILLPSIPRGNSQSFIKDGGSSYPRRASALEA